VTTMGKVNAMTLKRSTKFMLGIGLIVFIAVGSMSLFFYHYAKTFYIAETYQKTDLVLGHIDATMEYIKEELRPVMFHVLPKDEFVLEAMSTSFVNKGVMSRFSAMFPDYIYRRVAINPMNPMNQADTLEAGFIHRFSENPQDGLDWKGLVSKNHRKYFIHLKGVRMDAQCAVCHGPPENSPKSLRERYGDVNGHNWRVGDIVGLESIAIPMDATFFSIRQVAFSIFLIGLTGGAGLTLFLYYFYYLVTQRPLQKTSSFFKSIVSGEKGLDVRFEVKGPDEISELADSFNGMIDHLRRSQTDLMASESKYRRIFEGSKDAIVVADASGLVLDINKSGLDLLGFDDPAAVIGALRLHDIFETEAALEEFFDLLKQVGFVKDYETVWRKQNARSARVLITATRSGDGPSEERDYECIIKDITERKAMERQIRQADKLASIGQLAAGVAHEINNPLATLLTYCYLMKRQLPGGAPALDKVDVMIQEITRCSRIVRGLLDFAREDQPDKKPADINAILRVTFELVGSQAAFHNVEVAWDIAPDLPMIMVDASQMKQVLMNIIINAVEAMPGGGKLTLGSRFVAGRVEIYVSDTGLGIAQENLTRIFDPFFSTKKSGQGTGLGLAVSYSIIERHGGEIEVSSEKGRGTSFTIRLPV
jgi:two-component system NtrC family sensor kinase